MVSTLDIRVSLAVINTMVKSVRSSKNTNNNVVSNFLRGKTSCGCNSDPQCTAIGRVNSFQSGAAWSVTTESTNRPDNPPSVLAAVTLHGVFTLQIVLNPLPVWSSGAVLLRATMTMNNRQSQTPQGRS